MRQKELMKRLADTPLIAAVKDEAGLEAALQSSCGVVFLLFGTVVDIATLTARAEAAGKLAIVHLDLIEGLSPRDAAVDHVAKNTRASGIITTKPSLIRRAKSHGLLTVRRYFLLDSLSLQNLYRHQREENADLIEVLPGVMPKILREIAAHIDTPLIAGGLIRDKEDVVAAISAGAVAVSTTDTSIWSL